MDLLCKSCIAIVLQFGSICRHGYQDGNGLGNRPPTDGMGDGFPVFFGGVSVNISMARRLLMAELKAKRGRQKDIEAKVKQGLCLIEGCENEHWQRGVCSRHYAQFYNALRGLDVEARLAKEQEFIREGLILPPQEIRNLSADPNNPFRNVG